MTFKTKQPALRASCGPSGGLYKERLVYTGRPLDLSSGSSLRWLPDGESGGDREASALRLAAHDWLASQACRTEPSVWSLRAHTGCTPMQEPRSPLCKGLSRVAAFASAPWLWTVPDLARLYDASRSESWGGGQVAKAH